MTQEQKQARREYRKKWREAHAEYHRKWYEAHAEEQKEKHAAYYQRNKERLLVQQRDYHKKRMADPGEANHIRALACQRSKRYYAKSTPEQKSQNRIRNREWHRKKRVLDEHWRDECNKKRREARAKDPSKFNAISRAQVHRRRVRKLGNGGTHTAADIAHLYAQQKGCCAACGKSLKRGYEVDHIQPLLLKGSNDPSNLQLLCRYCNRSKGACSAQEWAQKLGKLFV